MRRSGLSIYTRTMLFPVSAPRATDELGIDAAGLSEAVPAQRHKRPASYLPRRVNWLLPRPGTPAVTCKSTAWKLPRLDTIVGQTTLRCIKNRCISSFSHWLCIFAA
jgi:hypothetical protein